MSPPASEWRSYCKAYLAAVDGDAREASDLEVTYCLGVTKGLLNGLRIGSQIGALSFGSRLAVAVQARPGRGVQAVPARRIRRACSASAARRMRPRPICVRAVLGYLDKNPAHAATSDRRGFLRGLAGGVSLPLAAGRAAPRARGSTYRSAPGMRPCGLRSGRSCRWRCSRNLRQPLGPSGWSDGVSW
ncbi:MAG: hypothetical protein MZV49_12670 [Rhodopseudomonas palustris]|nr:hypothetical protein [Rhodopseudomonas palustris]